MGTFYLRNQFCLCVDDFGVKYFSKDTACHLLNEPKEHYAFFTEWTGEKIGFTIEWDYKIDTSIYLCKIISQNPSNTYNSGSQINHNINRTGGLYHNMINDYKWYQT